MMKTMGGGLSGEESSVGGGDKYQNLTKNELLRLLKERDRQVEELSDSIVSDNNQAENLERRLEQAERECEMLRSSNDILRSSNRSVRNGAVWSDYEKQHVTRLSLIIKQSFGNKCMFLPDGWAVWSDSMRTVCGRIMAGFEIESTEERKQVWNSIVVPHLPTKMSEFKNHIGQSMKKSYTGE